MNQERAVEIVEVIDAVLAELDAAQLAPEQARLEHVAQLVFRHLAERVAQAGRVFAAEAERERDVGRAGRR